MSRRLRLEDSKTPAQKEEEVRKEDPVAVQLRRIFAPLVWQTTSTGFRTQDLKEQHYKQVLDIFKNYYLENDILCKNIQLSKDSVSVDCYLQRMLSQIRDQSSIVVVDEDYVEGGEEQNANKKNVKPEITKIVGAVILKVMKKVDCNRVFSQVKLIEGEAMEKLIGFRSYINRKVDVHEKCDVEVYLRVYEFIVLPEYRHKGLAHLLLSSAFNVAKSLNITIVAGFFSHSALQRLANRLGMETIYEVNYTEYRDSEGDVIFDDPGAGNSTCAVMAGSINASALQPKPPTPPPVVLSRPKIRSEKQDEAKLKSKLRK